MIIIVGGFLGNGAEWVASRLALRKGFYHISMNREMPKGYEWQSGGTIREKRAKFTSPDEAVAAFRRVGETFPKLSKMRDKVVISGTFGRREPRQYILDEARKSFDDVRFVWVTGDAALVDKRVEVMLSRRKVKSRREYDAMLKRQHEHFDELDPSDMRYSLTIETKLDDFLAAVEATHADRPHTESAR